MFRSGHTSTQTTGTPMSDTDTDASPSQPARHANGLFGPGNAGRPRGSRNRASQRMAQAILADFEDHRKQTLERLRLFHVPQYVKLLSVLLPKQIEIGASDQDGVCDEEAARIDLEVAGAAALDDDPGAPEYG
jgi:hypothetical protein